MEYKWLLIPDPADYRLAKPSATAIPMPKSHKDKQSLNTSARQADDNPRAEDPFVEGHTWAEFKNESIPRNAAQVKVNFAKENQIWHYLGRHSTEAKAQFTEDPANPRHNPKGNFLDTLPRPAPPPPRQSYAASYPSHTNQHVSTVSRVPSKLSLPPSTTSTAKPEKPYVYKPRNTGDAYRVDPQAYHSQQNFLQRSVPPSVPAQRPAPPQPAPYKPAYSFGTDPQYKTYPSSQGQYSTPKSTSPLAPPPVGPLAPQTHYRPSYPAAMPPKPNNPFSGRAPQATRPNPFAKYAYLQKEHNRSPLEYKSPYRPGGGFMNGYQGNLEKHLKQQLSQKAGSSSSPSSMLYSSLRTSYSTSQSPSSSSYGQTYNYGGASATSKHQTPPTSQGTPTPTQNNWQRKDNSQLHPAIRQEYHSGSMFHEQYQPPRQSPTQHQSSSVLQPPPMYNQAAYPPHTQHSQSQQSPRYSPGSHSEAPRAQQQSATNSQSHYNAAVPQYPTQSYRAPQSQQASQSPQPPVVQYSQQTYAQPAQQQPRPPIPQQPLSSITQQASQPPINGGQTSDSSHYRGQENKVYPHQVPFQKPQIQAHAIGPLAQAQTPYKSELADVPADSTTLVENMLANLKKAK